MIGSEIFYRKRSGSIVQESDVHNYYNGLTGTI